MVLSCPNMSAMNLTDRWLSAADSSLRTLFAAPQASRPSPSAGAAPATTLTEAERRLSGALMRVNHVGEVCAQALYTAQALGTPDPVLRRHLDAAAREETDHLAWTRERLDELGDRVSWLNPLWYAGAFGIGLLAVGTVAGIGMWYLQEYHFYDPVPAADAMVVQTAGGPVTVAVTMPPPELAENSRTLSSAWTR